MKHYEIFDGKNYRFTVSPSEDPYEVLADEQRYYRRPLHLVEVDNGRRTVLEPLEAATSDYDPEWDTWYWLDDEEDYL